MPPTKKTEEQVKVACELTFLFMLMHMDPLADSGAWYEVCTNESFKHPGGSYRQVFFWALRFYGQQDAPTLTAHEDFREYLDWKLEQYKSGMILSEGVKW